MKSPKAFSAPSIESAFDFEKSPLREAYVLLGAQTPLELNRKYVKAEQEYFIGHTWDYDNPNQLHNKIKQLLESVDEGQLTAEELEWRNEILWFWYHHAISAAGWRRDKEKQKYFAEKAVALQADDHPNMLTRTMYLLLHDKVDEAREWITKHFGDADQEIAGEMFENYLAFGELWPNE